VKNYVYFPFSPLDEFLEPYGPSSSSKGEAIGITGNAYRKHRRKNKMTWYTADKFAIALGVHPVLIWDDWYSKTTEGK